MSHPDHVPHGTPDMLRAEIAERMFPAGVYVQMVADCAAISDDAGLRYAIRCALAHVKRAAELADDLSALKAAQERHRQDRESLDG